jgi:hypothetical protein
MRPGKPPEGQKAAPGMFPPKSGRAAKTSQKQEKPEGGLPAFLRQSAKGF